VVAQRNQRAEQLQAAEAAWHGTAADDIAHNLSIRTSASWTLGVAYQAASGKRRTAAECLPSFVFRWRLCVYW